MILVMISFLKKPLFFYFKIKLNNDYQSGEIKNEYP